MALLVNNTSPPLDSGIGKLAGRVFFKRSGTKASLQTHFLTFIPDEDSTEDDVKDSTLPPLSERLSYPRARVSS